MSADGLIGAVVRNADPVLQATPRGFLAACRLRAPDRSILKKETEVALPVMT